MAEGKEWSRKPEKAWSGRHLTSAQACPDPEEREKVNADGADL